MYDVVVVGGGPAGSATATGFAAQGRSVLVLDAARFPRHKACAEYVSPGGAALLQRLGALERLIGCGRGRWLVGMQIQAPDGRCHLLGYRDQAGIQQQGLSVSRLDLDATLLDVARRRGATVRDGCRARQLCWSDHRVTGVVTAKGERIAAELVVGADGANSVVARAVGARRPALWPRRLGLIAHLQGVEWPEDYGQMLVGRHGYVGVAPLDRQGLVTVGLVRTMPDGRLGPARTALVAALAEYPDMAARLGAGRLVGSVVGVGPMVRRVTRVVGPGYALVGDAAGFFDPFTGEGIYRALRGAELLTRSPATYARARHAAFRSKELLVALIQVFVQTPWLMNLAVARLRERPTVARELGAALGDVQAARLELVWQLLGP
jgi:flavin-dependent dehydrogenase